MEDISIYTLSAAGIEMSVTNFGGRVMTLLTPDKNGDMGDIALGYNTLDEYLDNKGERFFGAVCGRYANRIAKGHFTLDGVEHTLLQNSRGQSLHGGLKGFDSVVWSVENYTPNSILFKYISPAGEEGFPGELTTYMSYELTTEGEFVIKYRATTNAATVVNLTHHSYFNLRGEGNGDVEGHELQIFASHYIPTDEVSIPTGEIASVEGTPFDFREAKSIGRDINIEDEQLKMGNGYDHSWVIADTQGEVRLAARVFEPQSGRSMEVYTDQVGMQLYTGNYLNGSIKAKDGVSSYIKRGALALETQLFPDSPNRTNFPSARLDVGEEYSHTCIYKFSV